MNTEHRVAYVTRANLLELLSDSEIASVSMRESALHLARGEEFIDLEALDRGIQRCTEEIDVAPAHVLPRSAVRAATWHKIKAELEGVDVATPRYGA